jgi:hypothetical protein
MFKRLLLGVLLAVICVSMIVVPASAATTTFYEAATTDDARITFNGVTYDFDRDYIQAGYFNAQHYQMQSVMRFANVQIPAGTTITSAYIVFTAAVTDAVGTVNTAFYGRLGASNTVSSYSDFATQWSSHTNATVSWQCSQWIANNAYQSSSIQNVVQEIVNNASWTSGGYMTIFWGDFSGTTSHVNGLCRRAYSVTSGGVNSAPRLVITYDSGSSSTSYAYSDPRITQVLTYQEALTNQVAGVSASIATMQNQISTLNSNPETMTKLIEVQNQLSALSSQMNTVSEQSQTINGNLSGLLTEIKTAEASANAAKIAADDAGKKVSGATTPGWIAAFMSGALLLIVLLGSRKKGGV